MSKSTLEVLSQETGVHTIKNTVNFVGTLKVGGVAMTSTTLSADIAPAAAGTVDASKVVQVGTNKEIDTLVIADGGLKLGAGAGTAVGATAAELNTACDVSAFTETLSAAGAITLSTSKRVHKFDTTLGAQTNTIPAPAANEIGELKILTMTVDGAADTVITLTNVTGGSAATTATFNDVNDTLVMVGGVNKWHIVKEIGVTMA